MTGRASGSAADAVKVNVVSSPADYLAGWTGRWPSR